MVVEWCAVEVEVDLVEHHVEVLAEVVHLWEHHEGALVQWVEEVLVQCGACLLDEEHHHHLCWVEEPEYDLPCGINISHVIRSRSLSIFFSKVRI
jgi:hypothetical protein